MSTSRRRTSKGNGIFAHCNRMTASDRVPPIQPTLREQCRPLLLILAMNKMIEKRRWPLASLLLSLIFFCQAPGSYAQADPCKHDNGNSYRLCGSDESAADCKRRGEREDQEVAEKEARCRAERSRRNNLPANNNPPVRYVPPPPPSPEELERRRREEERNRLNSAINDEIIKADEKEASDRLNKAIDAEMKSDCKGMCAGTAELKDPSAHPISPYVDLDTPGFEEENLDAFKKERAYKNQELLQHPPLDGQILEGCRWVTGQYRVWEGGSDKLAYDATVSAFIVKRNLEIENHTDKPFFFGTSGVVNEVLGPKVKRTIYLPIYQSKTDLRPITITLTARYCVPVQK